MDKRKLKRLEKTLFAMLGRQPDAFGIVLDEGGWIFIKELHQAVMKEAGFSHITPRDLTQFFFLYRPEKFEWQENHFHLPDRSIALTSAYCRRPQILLAY